MRVRRAARRGKTGEATAEVLLEKAGYRVLGRQVPCPWVFWVDGQAHHVTLRADFMVMRQGRRFVADAKTGKAARATDRSTRRQLLEYRLAFAVDGVLLVDADGGRIHEIAFTFPTTKTWGRSMWVGALLGLLVGLSAALLITR